MKLRVADILFKDRLAGTLVETASGGTCFTYDKTWTEDIACCFPITRREYEYSGMHPFFQNMTSEGWLREQQARVAHVVEEDYFGLLLRYGADCIGAVSVRSNEIPTAIDGTEALVNPGRTISGIHKKLLVVKDDETGNFSPALASGPAPYIAKFNSASIPTLVRNEALSLQWITSVLGKKEVTEFRVAFIQPINEVALVVTRFDRGLAGEKLRVEDFAQILLKPMAEKYDAVYEDIADIIKKHSVRAEIDLVRFYQRLITFALIGNCDAHLKNFSLLETPAGLRLAPVYDVINVVLYRDSGFDQQLALSICGKKRQLDIVNRKLFVEFGQEIGLTHDIIDQVFDYLKRQVRKAASILKPSPADEPDSFKHRFEEIVRNACLRILEE